MSLSFGTDGVRGAANTELTAEYALAFGRALARVLRPERVVVGRDTRISGPMLEGAVCAGLSAEGVAVDVLGVCPTPAVAWACAARSTAGLMISASHNPYGDNGLKVFSSGGLKLTDAQEADFTPVLDRVLAGDLGAASSAVGPVTADPSVLDGYAGAVAASIEGRSLDGLSIVVDCANGAASAVAPALLRRLGARVVSLSDRPDGTNINAGCGSTHLEVLQAAVPAQGADLGLAFDGDADRVLAVDHTGRVIDGDQLIAVCALDRHRRGRLAHGTVVVTVMTNLGFRLGMAARGIGVRETAVGDRYVLEELEAGGFSLGGEQSGHLIFRDLATTGDGLLSAVQVLDLCARSGARLADLADEAMTRLPQVLRNVRVQGPAGAVVEALRDPIAAATARLGDGGRVLVRPSGTEPVVRIMAEATDAGEAEAVVADLVAAAESARS